MFSCLDLEVLDFYFRQKVEYFVTMHNFSDAIMK